MMFAVAQSATNNQRVESDHEHGGEDYEVFHNNDFLSPVGWIFPGRGAHRRLALALRKLFSQQYIGDSQRSFLKGPPDRTRNAQRFASADKPKAIGRRRVAA
jgi:hypothetical protein